MLCNIKYFKLELNSYRIPKKKYAFSSEKLICKIKIFLVSDYINSIEFKFNIINDRYLKTK